MHLIEDFKKEPTHIKVMHILGIVAFILIISFVIFMVIATRNMLIDHYCYTKISASEAAKLPMCQPYLRP